MSLGLLLRFPCFCYPSTYQTRVAVRTGTEGGAPHMLVQGGKNGIGAKSYTGTKYLRGDQKVDYAN